MKRLSVTLILVSASLNIIFTILYLVRLFAGGLDFLSETIAIFVRFADLGLMIGLLGLFVSIKEKLMVKHLYRFYILLGMIRFLMIEFGLIESYTFLSLSILTLMLLTLVLLVLSYREHDIGVLFVKGIVFSATVGIYWLACLLTTLFSRNQNPASIIPPLTETALPFFFILYQIGILVYFYEYYKEVFIDHNSMILDERTIRNKEG